MSTSSRVLKSSFFLLAIQVVQRSLGIVSTLILARLLTPEHFGIVALVTIALQFFELLVETGNQQYIIQKDSIEDADLNTAWSMDVTIKTGMAIIVIACAPLMASYFDTPELTTALAVAALALPIRALTTPGMMLLAREINYQPVFKLTLCQKGASFLTVITIALIHPSHWAIIIGTLVSAVIMAVGSYRVHSYRPSWSLVHIRKQWQFSQWLLARGIVGFTRSQIDNLMVSKFFGTTQLGGYNMVREVSLLPALTAIIPMSQPLLAAIAENKYDPEILAYRIRLSLALTISVLLPLTTFMMLYPKLIVGVLLGEQWDAYAHLLRPFGLFFFTFCLFSLISDAIIAQGKVKTLFLFDVTSTLIIIGVLLLLGTGSLEAMAWTRGLLAVLTTLTLFALLDRMTLFRKGRLMCLCLPSLIASTLAAFLTTSLQLTETSFLGEFLIRGSIFTLISVCLAVAIAFLLLSRTEEWTQLHSLPSELKTTCRSIDAQK
jgi:lipopolysaccharide exporter